jgi:hypothetical protein
VAMNGGAGVPPVKKSRRPKIIKVPLNHRELPALSVRSDWKETTFYARACKRCMVNNALNMQQQQPTSSAQQAKASRTPPRHGGTRNTTHGKKYHHTHGTLPRVLPMHRAVKLLHENACAAVAKRSGTSQRHKVATLAPRRTISPFSEGTCHCRQPCR